MKGGLESSFGHRPCSLFSTKSATDTFAGGSNGSSGTHVGGLKTIMGDRAAETIERGAAFLFRRHGLHVVLRGWYHR